MKRVVVRAAAALSLSVGIGLGFVGAAAAAPTVTAWDLGIATAVEIYSPGQLCITAPQGVPVGPYTIIPKVLVPPVLGEVGGVTVVCAPGAAGPADVHSGIGYTPIL